jgi:hypothetical protein
LLIEAKMTMSERIPEFIKKLEKIAQEAYSEGREPALAMRWHEPKSVLADQDGWIDITIRRTDEDALRESRYENDD